jgi:hypothetical protein
LCFGGEEEPCAKSCADARLSAGCSDEAHSVAKILSAYGEKDERAKTATSEFILILSNLTYLSVYDRLPKGVAIKIDSEPFSWAKYKGVRARSDARRGAADPAERVLLPAARQPQNMSAMTMLLMVVMRL